MSATSLLALGGAALLLLAPLVLLSRASFGRVLAAAGWQRHLQTLDARLRRLFLPVGARAVVAGQAVLGALGAAGALSGIAPLPCFALLLLAVVGPRLGLAVAHRRRVRAVEAQLPGFVGMLGNVLATTASVGDALRHSGELTRGPLGQELDLVLKELKLGVPLPEALRGMAQRVGSNVLSSVVTILLVGRSAGGELPRLLEETAAALRERMRLEGVLRKQTAMGRTQLLVLLLSPPVIISMFRSVEPTFFEPLFTSGFRGEAVIAGAALLWVSSVILARKILMVEV